MADIGFTKKSFQLLKEIHDNNNREWYHENNDDLKEHLLQPFAEMLETVSTKLKNAKLPCSGSKQTMFRLPRDVRFSHDKRPYKEHIGGLLTPSGNKNQDSALLYAHLSAEGGFLAAGFYCLDTKVLNLIRDRIIEEPKQFTKVAKKMQRAGFEFDPIDPLKSMPRGYSDYAEHEHVFYLKMRSLVVKQPQTKEAWLDGSIVKRLVAMHKASVDFLLFGLEAIGDSR